MGKDEGKAGRVPPKGLDPLIFHASNIVLHGVVSVLVCWWVLEKGVLYIFSRRSVCVS